MPRPARFLEAGPGTGAFTDPLIRLLAPGDGLVVVELNEQFAALIDGYTASESRQMIEAAEKILPDLRQHIVYRTDASPVTYARYDWASAGSIYGVSRAGRLKGSKSPVRNLVIAGGGNVGAGVEAVVISGANAAEALVPGLLSREPAGRATQALPTHAAA